MHVTQWQVPKQIKAKRKEEQYEKGELEKLARGTKKSGEKASFPSPLSVALALSLSSLLCRPLQLSSRFFSAKRLRRRNKSPVPSKLARGPGRKGRAFRGPSSFRSSLSPSSVLAKSTTPSLTGNAMIYTRNQNSFLFPSRGSQARWGESPHHISPRSHSPSLRRTRSGFILFSKPPLCSLALFTTIDQVASSSSCFSVRHCPE